MIFIVDGKELCESCESERDVGLDQLTPTTELLYHRIPLWGINMHTQKLKKNSHKFCLLSS
jgi:hypothetical protein